MSEQETKMNVVEKLSPEQALNNLDIFTSRTVGSRQEHFAIQESIHVLAEALNIDLKKFNQSKN